MDITATNFDASLQGMLECLAGSHFVTLDLELSGVPSVVTGHGLDRMQDRYRDLKAAADKFSAVQVGFTIVHRDTSAAGGYAAYPYNMYLKPIIGERLDVSRNLTFSGRASEFLLEKGFNMQNLFREGVPYLSRREVAKAEKKETEKADGLAISDIDLGPEDVETHAFMAKIKHRINEWCKARDRTSELLVSHDQYLLTRAPEYGLSRFEKRLVYQIVRVEYPYLSATARGGAVEVTRFNKSRNDAIKKQRQAVFHECVQKQIGLGWFVEALIGGKIEDLDIAQLITRSTSQPILVDVEKSKNDFMDLCNQIRQTQIVLVGHNLFVDLVFLYRTFIGHLPQHVEEFCDAIHELFPRIIDTKFMATNANYRRSNSSLEDVDREYAQQSLPSIGITNPDFCKYGIRAFPHEAGYDSYLAARVLVRMSAFLATQHHTGSPAPATPTIGDQEASNPVAKKSTPEHDPFRWLLSAETDPRPSFPVSYARAKDPDNLIDLGPDDPMPPQQASRATQGDTPTQREEAETLIDFDDIPDSPVKCEEGADTLVQHEGKARSQIANSIPEWGSTFWQQYGNMLRVYGTEEGELKLGPFEA